jgi:hypothetical protein
MPGGQRGAGEPSKPVVGSLGHALLHLLCDEKLHRLSSQFDTSFRSLGGSPDLPA